MFILQQHQSFVEYPAIGWNGQTEMDILEFGDRVTIALNDEERLGGASRLYWWRSGSGGQRW